MMNYDDMKPSEVHSSYVVSLFPVPSTPYFPSKTPTVDALSLRGISITADKVQISGSSGKMLTNC